jgi:dolichyl-phosphate beta-glucosyltransferase
MDNMQKTAIIIPCYNEASRLKESEFIDYIQKNKEVYFIFVNDGSKDNTLSIIHNICNINTKRMFAIHLEKNNGKAEAVRQGFLKAMEMRFDNIGYWDADLSTPLYLIKNFCRLINSGRISLVMGARVKLLGRKIIRKAYRHYIGRIFATFVSLILGLPVYDTQCGAKIFKNNTDLQKIFSIPFTVKWIFDTEILIRLIIIKRTYYSGSSLEKLCIEYPLEEWSHIYGSKLKPVDFIISFIELFKIFLLFRIPILKGYYSKQFIESK